MSGEPSGWQRHPSEALRAGGDFSLASFDCAATPGFAGGKAAAGELRERRGARLSELQEMLHANARAVGDPRSVLVVLQGMDTSGKGGIVRHVVGMVDPQGVRHRSFGPPTEEERAHHYLWRVERALPGAGQIGVFDRSHYEDVLIVRVRNLVPPHVWGPRYDEINEFEQRMVDRGTTIVKCALMVSPEEQLKRLEERLERPDKHWKYNPGDLDERALWDDYMAAYQDALRRCSTEAAPWHVVPADRKWYARLAITELLATALEGLGMDWPPAGFDVGAERARVAALKARGSG